MQLNIYKDSEEVFDELAKWITDYVAQILNEHDRFTIALSGGETPKNLYKLLSAEPFSSKIDWKKIHIFWGDERVVPFTDERNNSKMAYETLLSKVNVLAANIHVMRTDVVPDISATEYEKILHEYFDNTTNSFDLVLLGMGTDGHTLSLFPSSPILNIQDYWVNAIYVDSQKMHRITLMPSIVNKANSVIFLTTGSEKAEALRNVIEGPYKPTDYPAQLIRPEKGELYWFVDETAAIKITSRP